MENQAGATTLRILVRTQVTYADGSVEASRRPVRLTLEPGQGLEASLLLLRPEDTPPAAAVFTVEARVVGPALPICDTGGGGLWLTVVRH